MSELVRHLREYWNNQTAVALREWRNEHGAVAVIQSEHRYTTVVILHNGKLDIMAYPVWNKHQALMDAEAIAALAGAEEVVDYGK